MTRVIENTVRALNDPEIRLVVITGEPPAKECPALRAISAVVPELGYRPLKRAPKPEPLIARIKKTARATLGGQADLWHIHNHALAKNTGLTAAVPLLAREGTPMFLHLHDFPEDGRPANYRALREAFGPTEGAGLRAALYPISPKVRYGVLNSRDARVLVTAGMPLQQIDLLPNPVETGPEPRSAPFDLRQIRAERLLLYCTRAIRRKNLGEMLLWAAIAERGEVFGCTLAPENPAARPVYRQWVALARRLTLPVEFELGTRYPGRFKSLIEASDSLISTSMAEGFGLAFLEPWLENKGLRGRDLPEVTGDFKAQQIRLQHLYRRLEVPLGWISRTQLERRVKSTLESNYRSYGLAFEETRAEAALASMIRDGTVDFGRLDEGFQARLIEAIVNDRSRGKALRPSRLPPVERATVQTNAGIIRETYSLERYGLKLRAAYAALASASPRELDWLEPRRVLDQFLHPERFCLIRT